MARLHPLAFVIALVLPALLAGCGGDKPPQTADEDATSRSRGTATATQPSRGTPTPAANIATGPTLPAPAGAATSGAALYVVGLDGFPAQMLDRLQAYFRDRHGIELAVLPQIPLIDREVADLERRQLVGERAVEAMAAALPSEAAGDVVIAVTEHDMMMDAKPEWGFVFSYRDPPLGLAVVSTARMDPRSFGRSRNDDLLFERMAKMVAKNVGVLYLGLPISDDPTSVMYNEIYSLDALDRIEVTLPR